MTEQALRKRITALRKAAEGLAEPARTNKLAEANLLKMQLLGMGLDQAANIMSGIKKADLDDLDDKIAKAQDATEVEQKRIKLITDAVEKIKKLLGLE